MTTPTTGQYPIIGYDDAYPCAELTPYRQNPRHGDIGAIAASLKAHGQYRPIVANVGTHATVAREVLAGNHTLQAAMQLGWSTVAVTWIDVDDDAAARIVLIDNRTNDLAGYDDTELADLLSGLATSPLQLEGTGFDGDDLDQLLAGLRSTRQAGLHRGREGTVTRRPDEPTTPPGSVWQLGEHILVCGDATDAAAYQWLPKPATLVWTDPPYGVDVQGRNEMQAEQGFQKNLDPVYGDDLQGAALGQLLTAAFTQARDHCTPDASIYTCGPPGPYLEEHITALRAGRWQYRHELVWVKHRLVFGRADYHSRHEAILFGWAERHKWHGDRKQTSVFEVPKPRAHKLHPTSKPIPLIEPMLENSSSPGDWVIDGFGGSGSTLVACENLGRRSYTIEIDPAYCDVILERWHSLNTDITPTRLDIRDTDT